MNNLMKKLLFSPLARTVYLPIVALALLAGCSNSSTESSDASSSDAGGFTFSTEEERARFEEARAQHTRIFQAVNLPVWRLENQYKGGMISADKLYESARDIVEKAAEDEVIAGDEAIPSYAIESVGHKLLNYLLQDGNASPEGVGYFTDMLMSIESPNADMILEALHVLDGYWTEAQIRTTANEAIRNAEQWLRHTDEGVRYTGKDRPAIIASVRHLQSIASL